jgi:hypothetical protein
VHVHIDEAGDDPFSVSLEPPTIEGNAPCPTVATVTIRPPRITISGSVTGWRPVPSTRVPPLITSGAAVSSSLASGASPGATARKPTTISAATCLEVVSVALSP